MTEPHDPMRALDGHERPPSWDDVVARAERPARELGPDVDSRHGRRGRTLLAVAAVLVAVAGIGTAIVNAGQSPDETKVQVTGPPSQLLPPTDLVGHVWQLTRIVKKGSDAMVIPAGEHPSRVAITKQGKVTINQGCGQIDGRGHVDGTQFVADGLWVRKATCTPMYADPETEAAARLIERREADWLQGFLEHRPSIELSGMGLTLFNDKGDRVEFLDFTVFSNPETIDLYHWRITAFVVDGDEREIRETQLGAQPGFGFVNGQLSYSTFCNSGGGPAAVDGEVLYGTGNWVTTLVKCNEDLSGPIAAFLRSLPVVQIHGKDLVLSRGDDRLEAVAIADRSGRPETTTSTTAAPTTTAVTTTAVTATTVASTPTVVTSTTVPTDPMDDIPDFVPGHWIVQIAEQQETSTGYEGATFDTSYVGPPNGPDAILVHVSGCNGSGGRMRYDGSHLFMVEESAPAAVACLPSEGHTDLSKQDEWFGKMLRTIPRVTYSLEDDTVTIQGRNGQVVVLERA